MWLPQRPPQLLGGPGLGWVPTMVPTRAILAGSILSLMFGVALLLVGFFERSTSCTTLHGTLEECAVQYPSWAIYPGEAMVAVSGVAALIGWWWRRSHMLAMP